MPTGIARALIHWHGSHGRHDLPWQTERTPYRIWVSEIMLQQTQVATVLGYYQRFMQRFPDVASLAAAPLDEILHLWSGLGYYSRARNLHRAAQCIVSEHAGVLPDARDGLAELPGIGRSTAAAILALAWGRREAILDGNVRRVLSRYFAIDGAPGERNAQLELWRRAEECTPLSDVAVYTQAIMDFGATLCTRRRPGCLQCPLSGECAARLTGRVHELPAPRRPSTRPTRGTVMLLVQRADGGVLLQRRPAHGVWGGMWTPPEFTSRAAAEEFCGARLHRAQLEPEALPELRHVFTHFELRITPLRARCEGLDAVMEGPETLWYNAREPAHIGLPAPIAALLSSTGNPRS
jgi:A/G-specific adenine glycosylase